MSFDKAGPQTHYLHPSSLVFLLLSRIRSYLIPAVVAAAAAAGGSRFLALMLVAAFLLALAVDTVRLFTLRYRITDGELVVRMGLLFRQQRNIPLNRIQNIDLLQNPLHRLLHVAEVRVETASGSEPEATLRVLSLSEVERLKAQLRKDPGQPAEQAVERVDTRPQRRTLLALSPIELTKLGLISNRGMVLVAIAWGVCYELDLPERLDWGWAEDAARAAQDVNLFLAVTVGLLLLIAALVTLRLLSVLWFLLRFYGYELTTDGENLRLTAGLFTRVSATVPTRRVQFISIHRSLLARWIARASIRIETAGGAGQADEDASATISRRWFAPIVAEQAVPRLMHELRPGLNWNEQQFDWRGLHPRAAARLTRKALLAALGVSLLGLALWRPLGALAGPVLLPVFIWHARRYAASLKYARFEQGVVFRSGVLTKKTSVTFFDKVQVVDIRQSPFDRRWHMAGLNIDTAAAGPAEHRVHIKLLEQQFARDELSAISQLAARHRMVC